MSTDPLTSTGEGFETTDNTILLIGGARTGVAILTESKWIEIESNLFFPPGYDAYGSGAVSLNGDLYVFGGKQNPTALYKLDKNIHWSKEGELAYLNIERHYITNSCLAWNGYIWVFGGESGKKPTNNVERYDPKENKWTVMPEMNHPRSRASAVLWKNRIIVSGGYTGNDGSMTNTVEYFDLESGSWIELPEMPHALIGHSTVSYKDKLIAIGGRDKEVQNKAWEVDPINGTWKPLPSMEYPSIYFTTTVLNDEIYAIGGLRKQGQFLDRTEIFNGVFWRDGPSLPYNWSGMSAVNIPEAFAYRLYVHESPPLPTGSRLAQTQIENTILLVGGKKNNYYENVGIVLLNRFDEDNFVWVESQLPLPPNYVAHGSGAVYLNRKIYLFGGYNNPTELYSLEDNLQWIQRASMHIGRMGITNSCLQWNGFIWVFGGWDENHTYLNSVERYDPDADNWTVMPNMNMRDSRVDAAAMSWDDRLIISGGMTGNGQETNTVECFNNDGRLADLPRMLNAIYQHSLAIYGMKLVELGGKGTVTYSNVSDIDPDEANATWIEWPDSIVYPSNSFAAIALDRMIFVIGGIDEDDEMLDRVEIFKEEEWIDGPPLPYKWYGMSAVIIPERLADRLRRYTPE